MYYKEFARIQKMQKFLENLAYASIGLDAALAVTTLLVIRGVLNSSASLLTLSDYLVFIEVAVAAVMLTAIVALKSYSHFLRGLDMVVFKVKHRIARV